ncbi:cell division protein FtsA [Patescibacteria group bacterium]|nr:cell division protein FtsA [Patescibacteria group bacterium]
MRRNTLITGVDIGTGGIKILAVTIGEKESDPEVLGITQAPVLGVRKGTVINVEEVSNSLRSALEEFQDVVGQKIDSAVINLSGSHIFVTPSKGVVVVSRADKEISQEDIERVMQAAQTFSLPSNKEILEVLPKEFIIDGEKGIKEPLGLQGVRLEVEILALGGFSPYIKNLTKAVLNSGIQISDIAISPLASSRSILTPRQKELGVALLDIGAGTSGLAVFEEGDLIHTTIFPVGSAHITNDIAVGLKTDIDTAERIKIEFGSCLWKASKKKEKIKKIGKKEPLMFSQKMLGNIIEARMSEIFDLTNKELKKISRQGKLPSGVVLTGGGVKLPRIVEFAKKELKLPCQIEYPSGIIGLEKDPALSLVSGLVLRGIDLEEDSLPSFQGGFFSKFKKVFRIFIP